MRKFFTLFALVALCGALTSCNNDDKYYITTSGEGSIVVDNSSHYLHRMIFFNGEQQQEIYLMGGTASVNSSAEFGGSGAVIKFILPPDTENLDELLEAQSFDIGTTYTVSYSKKVKYSDSDANEMLTELASGTVIIRRSGSYYDIRVLGLNDDGENVLISYGGYIYRWFLEVEDNTDDDPTEESE